ncbi:MAG: four helix bundle protein [Halioglobus sp.]|jgi:four helix bundle protein
MKHNYKKMDLWKVSRTNNLKVYSLTNKFPKEELYGLSSQLRRSIVSVSSNIAEGSGYESDAQFLRFLNISMGSLCEAESQIYLAFDLKYINSDDLNESEKYMTDQKRLIRGMIKKLKKDNGYSIPFWISIAFLSISSLF